MKEVTIYTDGSCLYNPGPGGWAAILELNGTGHIREMSGGVRLTTNIRMELMAAIKGIDALKEPCRVEIVTDCKMFHDAVALGWLARWEEEGLDRRANGDLWKRILRHMERHDITVRWIKGHNGHPMNMRCDYLAKSRVKDKLQAIDRYYEKTQGMKNGK